MNIFYITIYIHNRIYDDSSNQYRILREIECAESEFGCCKDSLMVKKDYLGTNCGLYIHNIDKIYLSLLFLINVPFIIFSFVDHFPVTKIFFISQLIN